MARLVLNGALNRNAANPVAGVAGPRYAFISNPACCPKCSMMDSRRTGRLYSVADPWRISHINCLCYTVEVPQGVGIDAQSVMSFAANPVGGILRRGFNFGQSLAPVKLTAGNIDATLGKAEKMASLTNDGKRRALARAAITAQRKGAYRRAFNKVGKENWNSVEIEVPKKRKAGAVKVRKARSVDDVFTPTGRVSKSARVDVQQLKKKAAKIKARRGASGEVKKLAKLFGAVIK